MKTSTKQYHRLKVVVEEINKNNFPSIKDIQKALLLVEYSSAKSKASKVSERTIRRDIEELQNEFNAPIEYCRSNRGYGLQAGHHQWLLPYTDFDREQLFAGLLANKIAEESIPSSMKEDLASNSGVQLVAGQDSKEVKALVEELFIQSQFTTQEVCEELSAALLEAWEKCQSLEITYTNSKHIQSQRLIELHVIFLYNNTWYGYARDIEEDRFRYFSVHRCSKASVLDRPFIRSEEAVKKIKSGHVFEHEIVKDIKLQCSAKVARYASERKYFPEQSHTWSADQSGELTITIPEAHYHKICPHVLQFKGEVKVLEPQILKDKIRRYAEKILENHK